MNLAKAAQAHDFILNFADGYNTVVGERGVTLSGGQRQRLALAWALLTDPKILILDDATSAIDSATEDQIQHAIYSAARGRTTILITHRLSQIRWADVIVVMKQGQVAAVGSHDDLMAQSAAYRNIFARRGRCHCERLARHITAKVDGTLVLPRAEDLPGRFVHRGDVLAHVVDLNTLTVRTIVDQTDIDLIRHSKKAVQVLLAERLASPIEAGVTRLVPAASDDLPSPALGSEGGGQVPMDPKDPKGQKAMRKVFQVDLQLPLELGIVNVGGRVYVRFDHGWEPLMAQWYRQGRQLFLSLFNV